MLDFSSYTDGNYQNIIVLLAAVVGVTALAFFLLPLLMKSRNFRVSASISLKKIKQNPIPSSVVGGFVVLIFVGAYLLFLSGRPVLVSGEQFKSGETESLEYIQGTTPYFLFKGGDLFLADARSKKEFEKAHVKNSFNIPPENLEQNRLLPFVKGKKVAVYARKDSIDRANEVANYLKKNVTDKKVYVIKGGYESLAELGFSLRTGDQYESRPIKNEKK